MSQRDVPKLENVLDGGDVQFTFIQSREKLGGTRHRERTSRKVTHPKQSLVVPKAYEVKDPPICQSESRRKGGKTREAHAGTKSVEEPRNVDRVDDLRVFGKPSIL